MFLLLRKNISFNKMLFFILKNNYNNNIIISFIYIKKKSKNYQQHFDSSLLSLFLSPRLIVFLYPILSLLGGFINELFSVFIISAYYFLISKTNFLKALSIFSPVIALVSNAEQISKFSVVYLSNFELTSF